MTKKKAPPKKERDLTLKQHAFVLEFVKDMNATRAYKAAYGASQKVAEVNGCKLLSNAKVQAEIKKQIDKNFASVEIDGQWVIQRLIELVDRCMQKKPVMIRDGKDRVQETDSYIDENGVEKEWGVRRFDSAGANTALANLGKYYNVIVDKHLITTINLSEEEEGTINTVVTNISDDL